MNFRKLVIGFGVLFIVFAFVMVDHQRREFEKKDHYFVDPQKALIAQSERNSEYESWLQEKERLTEEPSTEKEMVETNTELVAEEDATTENYTHGFNPALDSEDIQKEIKSISYEPEKIKNQEEISEEDFIMLEKLVFAEAGTDTFEAKISIVACVLNRLRIQWNGQDSVEEIIEAPYQFASIGWLDEDNREDWDAAEIRQAVWEALLGSDPAGERLGEPIYAFYVDQGLSDYEAYVRKDLTSKVHTKDGSITWFLGKTGIGECHWD